MDSVELAQRGGYIMLGLLVLVGAGGVGLHVWWSSTLKFFDFGTSDSTNKGNHKRLFYPLIPVSILGVLTPVVAVMVSPAFRSCLEDPNLPQFLSRFWTYLLPVVGTGIGISAAVCALTGIIVYWLLGLVLYLISKRGY